MTDLAIENERQGADIEDRITLAVADSPILVGVTEAAAEAEQSVVDVATLVTADRRRLLDSPKAGSAAFRLFELLSMMPRFTVRARPRPAGPAPTAERRTSPAAKTAHGARSCKR